jgi:DNA repair protein RecO (recombination protein O)
MAAHITHAHAILIGRVDYGEADVIAQLFTDRLGRISVLARGARRSQKRFGGALEPFHTLRVGLTAPARGELFSLKDAAILRPRLSITTSLERLEAAAEGLSWLKRSTLPTNPELSLFERAETFLDALSGDSPRFKSELSAFGFHLLDSLGFGLNFSSCVSCDKECPEGKAAWVHPARGGIICVECGGGPIRLPADLRTWLARREDSPNSPLSESDDALLLRIVERALEAHMGV